MDPEETPQIVPIGNLKSAFLKNVTVFPDWDASDVTGIRFAVGVSQQRLASSEIITDPSFSNLFPFQLEVMPLSAIAATFSSPLVQIKV